MTEFASMRAFVGAPRVQNTDWPIVSMVSFKDRLFVATTNGVFEMISNEFVPIKFVVLPPDGV